MAKKKKAAKKVSTKLDEGKAKGQSTEEVLADVVEEMSEEEVADLLDEAQDEVVDAGSAIASMGIIDDNPLDDDEFREIKVRIPVSLKIKRKHYAPGVHVVERHMVPTIMEMVAKKQAADLSIFTGKNFLVKRLLDRSLVVQEVDDLNLKKMAQ